MEETLHDAQGNAIAYVDHNDDKTIYLWDGTPTAYLDSTNKIFGFNGKHLGWFEDGIIWDLNGHRSGYTKKTLPVFANFEPFKSFKQFKPFKSFQEFSKFKPFKSTTNSKYSLGQHLSSGKK